MNEKLSAKNIIISIIISALIEDRPYRSSFDQAQVTEILLEMGSEKLDSHVLDVILQNMNDIYSIAQNMKSWSGSKFYLLSAELD